MAFLTALGTIAAVASAGAAAKGAIDARKAQKEQLALQKEALAQGASGGISGNAQTGQVDIQALDTLTREMARKNALESAQLEQQLNPEVASLRRQSIESLQQDLGPDAYDQTLRQGLLADFTGATGTPRSQLSQDVYGRAASDLALGGAIPQDVQNAITRRAAAQSGRVGGGLDLGRDITARDLGLTSLDLANNRLAVAQTVGNQTDQFNLAQQQQALNERLQSAGLISSMGNADTTRRLAIANLTQGIEQPVTGLDPGAAAALAVGNTGALQAYLANQQALAAQNKNASNAATGQLIGQLPGLINSIGGAYNQYKFNNNVALGNNPAVNTSLNNFFGNLDAASSTMNYGNPSVTYPAASSTPTSYFGGWCWVARSAYGPSNPRWLEFRKWLLNDAPRFIKNLYGKFGPGFAKWLDSHARFKPAVRFIMDAILDNRKQRGAA